MYWYLEPLRKFAVFKGRARRMEFWSFFLGNLIIGLILVYIDNLIGFHLRTERPTLLDIFEVSILVPSISAGVRRMHDNSRTGWWLLVPIYNFLFLIGDGTRGDNRFGPDPMASSPTA